mmetsp:Transcript_39936/g.77650  ORF Transcript_39936/g.77650 Transcript_39936/m.77650 type:complete len:211 (-) Transcript_39936:821-1453(-)
MRQEGQAHHLRASLSASQGLPRCGCLQAQHARPRLPRGVRRHALHGRGGAVPRRHREHVPGVAVRIAAALRQMPQRQGRHGRQPQRVRAPALRRGPVGAGPVPVPGEAHGTCGAHAQPNGPGAPVDRVEAARLRGGDRRRRLRHRQARFQALRRHAQPRGPSSLNNNINSNASTRSDARGGQERRGCGPAGRRGAVREQSEGRPVRGDWV